MKNEELKMNNLTRRVPTTIINYSLLFIIFLSVGCSCKDSIVYKYVEQNITIPNEFLKCKNVEPFKLEENSTKNDWRLHISELKDAHDSCQSQMESLKQRWGDE